MENIDIEFLDETLEETQTSSSELGGSSKSAPDCPTPSTSGTLTAIKRSKKRHSDRPTDDLLLESIGDTVNMISTSLKKKESGKEGLDKSSEHIFGEFIASELAKITDKDILYEAKEDIIRITFDALRKVRQLSKS